MESVSFRWGPRFVAPREPSRAEGHPVSGCKSAEAAPATPGDRVLFTCGASGILRPAVDPLEALAAAFAVVGGPLGAVGRSLWEAVEYELRALPEGARVADRLAPLAEQTALTVALTLAGNNPSALAVLQELDRRLLSEVPEPAEQDLYREASDRARDYLGLNDLPVALPRAMLPPPNAPAPPARPGLSKDAEAVKVEEVAWPGVADYVESRLGPAAWLLDDLGPEDRVRFSNLSLGRSLEGLPPLQEVERLNLPISSWSKAIDMVTHADGTRTLVMGEFPGGVLMRHFQLMVRHRLAGREDAPSVSVVEDPAAYEGSYDGMAALFRARRQDLQGVRTVAVGYDYAFREHWADRLEGTVTDPGSPWKADLYRLPDGGRMAVLSTPTSFHGEILGQNLRRTVMENPGIRQVFAGGSAGSLHAREPYSFVFPQRLEGPSGGTVRNTLGPESEAMVHRSVLSPLAETPELLRRGQADQVATVDLEMGPVAEALADLDVQVGVGLLVTDFPAGPSFEAADLARQDPARKYAHLRDFTEAVRGAVEGAPPPRVHPLEEALGRDLRELSKENLARELEWLGPLTPDETRLFQRIQALEPPYSFRLTTARLRRVLQDDAILSTAQVASLKGAPVKPYTPRVEDDLYGAFGYTFGALEIGDGDDRYGEARLVVRPETVRARSFATYRSGWAALEKCRTGPLADALLTWDEVDPALLEAARRRLGEWVVTPEHYTSSMAAYAVEQARRRGPEALADLLQASDEEFPRLLERYDLGYLEGKIRGAMTLQDLAFVEVPADTPEDVMALLEERGLEVRVKGPRTP